MYFAEQSIHLGPHITILFVWNGVHLTFLRSRDSNRSCAGVSLPATNLIPCGPSGFVYLSPQSLAKNGEFLAVSRSALRLAEFSTTEGPPFRRATCSILRLKQAKKG